MDNVNKSAKMAANLNSYIGRGQPQTSGIKAINSEQPENQTVTVSDNDDDVYMWVEQPIVVNLVSSDEDEKSNAHNLDHDTESSFADADSNNVRNGVNDMDVNHQEKNISRGIDPLHNIVTGKVNKAAARRTSDHLLCRTPASSNNSVTSVAYSVISTDHTVASPNHTAVSTSRTASSPMQSAVSRVIKYPADTLNHISGHRLKRSYDVSEANDFVWPESEEWVPSERFNIVQRKKKRISLESNKVTGQSDVAYNSQSSISDEGTRPIRTLGETLAAEYIRDFENQTYRRHNGSSTNDNPRDSRIISRYPAKSLRTNLNLERSSRSTENGTEQQQFSCKLSEPDNDNANEKHKYHGSNMSRSSASSSISNKNLAFSDGAKTILSKKNAAFLLSTERGYNFLNEAYNTHRVKIRMEWERFNNVLVVFGMEVDQARFKADLNSFLQLMSGNTGGETSLPKNKDALVRVIQHHFDLLKQPLGNVDLLYDSIKINEKTNTKNATKRANRERKSLNMILMGQAGVRDGRTHLAELQRLLRTLLELDSRVISRELYEEIQHHFIYIFSAYRHDNYTALIAEYKTKNVTALTATHSESQTLVHEPVECTQQQQLSSSCNEAESWNTNYTI